MNVDNPNWSAAKADLRFQDSTPSSVAALVKNVRAHGSASSPENACPEARSSHGVADIGYCRDAVLKIIRQ